MTSNTKLVLQLFATLVLSIGITLLIPWNQGSIDIPLHDTYFVIDAWTFGLGLWIVLTFILLVGLFILNRIFKPLP